MRHRAIHITLAILILSLAPLAHATDDTKSESDWEKSIEKEEAMVDEYIDAAYKGDRRAMAVLIRLADKKYIDTLEGSEWLNEIYLDLMVRHPYRFLLIVSKEPDRIKDRVVRELLNPLTYKYSKKELRNAMLRARKKGLEGEFIDDLIEYYSNGNP